jgi:hypothetical protein
MQEWNRLAPEGNEAEQESNRLEYQKGGKKRLEGPPSLVEIGIIMLELKCRHRPWKHEVGHVRLEFDVFMNYYYSWSWRCFFLAVAFPVPHS